MAIMAGDGNNKQLINRSLTSERRDLQHDENPWKDIPWKNIITELTGLLQP